jgi:hypothetical protein
MPEPKKITPKKTENKGVKTKQVKSDIRTAITSDAHIVIRETNIAIGKCDYAEVNGKMPANVEMNKAVLIEMALKGILDKEGKVLNCTAKINNSLDNETIVFS